MNDWVAKRFWSAVSVVSQDDGFTIHLDARPVKTPAKAALIVPTRDFAEEIAEEWRAVDVRIDPLVMPFTRTANAAIDKVTVQFDEVVAMLAAYGGSDLLCYRADAPAELVNRQVAAWDPLLDWAHDTFDARLVCTVGVMPITQDADALARLAAPLYAATPFQLAALHDLIAMSGSLVLALAVTQSRLSADAAWAASRIDEDWQIEQWGEDEDAQRVAAIKQDAFAHAARVYHMSNTLSEG